MASNIAAKCSARSAISQAENFAPVITACLTPGGSNTSLGNTEHARKPPDVSRCLTKENQSRFNAAANVKLEQRETATYDVPDLSKCHKEETIPPCSLEAKNKSDETSQNAFEENGTSQSGKRYDILNEISKAFQDIPLSGNDRFLYDDVMETATREINRFLHYGQLRVRLESRRDPVLIEFGDGKDEISCYFKNGVTNWIATKPAIIKYTSKERLDAWVRKVGRLPAPGQKSGRSDGLWEPKEHDRICSLHFVNGCPSKDTQDVDYIPSLFAHTPAAKKTPKILAEKINRHNRVRQREEHKSKSAAALALLDLADRKENVVPGIEVQASVETMDTGVQTDWTGEHINEYEVMFSSQMDTINKQRDSLSDAINMLKTQNDQVSLLLKEVEQLAKKAIDLQKDLDHLKLKAKTCLLFDIVQSDDSKIHFYTGIPNLSAFLAIFNAAKNKVKRKGQKLDLKDECLLTLVKLRHNPSIQDLAYRFGISKSLANRIFHAWLDALYKTVGGLVIWPAPDKECQLPDVFNNEQFRKVRCIIDCTEIFIERPTRLKARAETFSNYKRHNTVKVLIGVSPSGCVTFISDVWGGRVSDKKITLESGLLDKFVPGDAVMADRGFLVHDEFAFRQVTLIMPAFTKGKKQLTAMEVEKSRQMSRARIHIERIIGRLKDFNILSGPLPIALVRKKGTVKKILYVVSAIFNLNPAIV